MLIDLLIIFGIVSAIYRGRSSGLVRQGGAFIGFFGGLFLGSWLQPHTVALAHTATGRALIVVVTTLGCALVGLSVGEYLGLKLKLRLFKRHINKLDNGLGSALSVVSLLISAWLLAAIVTGLPSAEVKSAVRSSKIITGLNRLLPPAPNVIASLGHLIDPNGFPDVFIGNEPVPPSNVNLPSLGSLAGAVSADQASVLRIRGLGCGGIVSGSGFVIGNGLVATNAHVVAGINQPYVQDSHGSHAATVIWFDPNLDFAILKVNNLREPPLTIFDSDVSRGTPAAVLGYPGGGSFSATSAAVLDEFNAIGRNIYGTGHTFRDVYEIQADIIPGNSGGPLVDTNGQVIGVVFAESTAYNHVGYVLTTPKIISEVNQAKSQGQPVSTGSCAE